MRVLSSRIPFSTIPSHILRMLPALGLAALLLSAPFTASVPSLRAADAPSGIHLAAQTGDIAKIKHLVEGSRDVLNEKNSAGALPLHTAAGAGEKLAVETLLSLGAEIDAPDAQNATALHAAASAGKGDVVDFLLAKGADLRAIDANGMTVLHFATYNGHTDLAERLIGLGIDVNARKTNASTPLHGAALGGFVETVRMLLAKGADPNIANVNGFTPLLTAASAGRTDVAEVLIAAGADIAAKLPNGQTALHYAAWTGKTDLVEMLIAKGMSPNQPDGGEAGPLIGAMYGGFTETVKALLAAGADVNQKSQDGRTPIFAAATGHGSTEIAGLLIDRGADAGVVDVNGIGPLDLAVQNGLADVAALLAKNGADVNRKAGAFGWTALHSAAVRGDKGMAEMLLGAGADVNVKDGDGKTALELAASHGHEDVANLLVVKGATAAKLDKDYGRSALLGKALKPGEAVLWHLGHCGWAVKTQTHLLIFDYWNRGALPAQPCLANGHIDASEIADLKTIVFVTHEHQDHFDSTIFDWRGRVKDITYVYGFKPEETQQYAGVGYPGPAYEYVGPRQNKQVGDIDVSTIAANDAGVGFLVKVDGLTLYHAGDHAGWADGEKQGYLDEIDYLAGLTHGVDLAFVNVTGCHAHNPDALKEGLIYSLTKVPPKVLIPTHGADREWVYAEAARDAAEKGFTMPVACPKARGDHYLYAGGKLQ
jgi:ankyrin repeat protein/L-ascorbate metabolism protein UlaG (beta-lactamase superfamily)